MALPTSGPLSLSMIAAELGVNTPYSLQSMSQAAGFGTPYGVNNFYGYSHITLTEFFIVGPGGHPNEVCGFNCSTPAYHDGSELLPIGGVGESVYADSSGTQPLENGYYGMNDRQGNPSGFSMFVEGGIVVSISACR